MYLKFLGTKKDKKKRKVSSEAIIYKPQNLNSNHSSMGMVQNVENAKRNKL